jgi:hypothetical protein
VRKSGANKELLEKVTVDQEKALEIMAQVYTLNP